MVLLDEIITAAAAQAMPVMPAPSNEPQWVLVGLGILGFIITLITLTGTVVWQAGKIKEALMLSLAEHKKEVKVDIDEAARQWGEVGRALREKISQIELFVRDEFIRKDTFNIIVDRISSDMKSAAAATAAWQLRMEGKIDDLAKQTLRLPPWSKGIGDSSS